MIKVAKIIVLLALFGAFVVALDGCSEIAQLTAVGSDAHITCYSGDKVIFAGMSNGKISTEKGSDGWFFQNKQTGRLIRVSGACVIEN